jgi:tRNA 2-thiocytidine biosynthesis protein TtcA
MLAEWERQYPGRSESIFSALRNVETAHLADPKIFDFAGLDAETSQTHS